MFGTLQQCSYINVEHYVFFRLAIKFGTHISPAWAKKD